MRTIQIDPTWLVDSFEYERYIGTDGYGGVVFAEPVTVENCRIDYKNSYSRNNSEVLKIGDGTIYCYGKYTTGVAMNELVEKSKVKIDGRPYTVKAVSPYREIASREIYSVEMVIL